MQRYGVTIYRLKPPRFEARQFSGSSEDIVNGFFEWLGDGAAVIKANAKEARISILQYGKDVELQSGEWVVLDQTIGTQIIVPDERFKNDFEVDE